MLPGVTDSTLSILLYVLLAYSVAMGFWSLFLKYRYTRRGESIKVKSLIPVGCVATIFGILGYFMKVNNTFSEIERSSDISPSLVAGQLGNIYAYPALGLIVLAITLAFKYVND